MNLRTMRISTKLLLQSIITVVIIYTLFFGIFNPFLKRFIRSLVLQKPMAVTDAIINVASGYDLAVKSGRMTIEDAQVRLINAYRVLRYGKDNSGYFAIMSSDGKILMHGTETALEGTDARNIKINGSDYYSVVSGLLSKGRDGFIEYEWVNPVTSAKENKITYVRKFESWDWIFITGIYDTELGTILTRTNIYVLGFVILITTILGIFSFFSRKELEKSIMLIKQALDRMRTGDFTVPPDVELISGKEMIDIAESIESVRSTAYESISRVKSIAEELSVSSEGGNEMKTDREIMKMILDSNLSAEEIVQILCNDGFTKENASIKMRKLIMDLFNKDIESGIKDIREE